MDFRLNLFPFFHALRIAMRAQGILLLFSYAVPPKK